MQSWRGRSRPLVRLVAVMALALCSGPAHADGPVGDETTLEQGQHAFAQGRYEAAVQVLEGVVNRYPESASALLYLGKAYGRLAQSQPWYRAVTLARRCGTALERAVELAPENREALSALARFYEEAPALVGGGADKAVALRERLSRLRAR